MSKGKRIREQKKACMEEENQSTIPYYYNFDYIDENSDLASPSYRVAVTKKLLEERYKFVERAMQLAIFTQEHCRNVLGIDGLTVREDIENHPDEICMLMESDVLMDMILDFNESIDAVANTILDGVVDINKEQYELASLEDIELRKRF